MLNRRTMLLAPLALAAQATGATVWKTTGVGMSTHNNFAFCSGLAQPFYPETLTRRYYVAGVDVGADQLKVEVWLDPDHISRADVQSVKRWVSAQPERLVVRHNVRAEPQPEHHTAARTKA